jgi:ribosomal protein S18 acetylase RimI-like enzyme
MHAPAMNPPKSPVLRPITARDAEALRDLYAYSLRQNPAGFVQDPLRHGDIFSRAELYRKDNGEMLGLFSSSGELMGFGALQKKSPALCELCNLHLHPDFQGRGFGRYMAEHLIELAKTLEYRTIELHVTATQHKAISLYGSLGFAETRRQTYETHGQKFETIFMERTA